MGYFYSQQQCSLALGLVSCSSLLGLGHFARLKWHLALPLRIPWLKRLYQYWWNKTELVPTREHRSLVCVLKWRNGKVYLFWKVYLFCWKLQKIKSGVLQVRNQPGASSEFLQDKWVWACFPVGKAWMVWGLHQIKFKCSGWEDQPWRSSPSSLGSGGQSWFGPSWTSLPLS